MPDLANICQINIGILFNTIISHIKLQGMSHYLNISISQILRGTYED